MIESSYKYPPYVYDMNYAFSCLYIIVPAIPVKEVIAVPIPNDFQSKLHTSLFVVFLFSILIDWTFLVSSF